MVVSSAGSGIGRRLAWGKREKKRVSWLWERASARALLLPGRCLSETVNWF